MNQKSTKTVEHLWRKPPSCLDAAYERKAIEQGLVVQPVFKENNLQEEYAGYIIQDKESDEN